MDDDRRSDDLHSQVLKLRGDLAALQDHNARVVATLREAREQIVALKAEIDQLSVPPSSHASFLQAHDDGTVDVMAAGRKLRVAVSPNVDITQVRFGQEVVLNDAMAVVDVRGFEVVGELVRFKERLADGRRALVVANADEERVAWIADPLVGARLRAGDSLLFDSRSGFVYEKVPKAEVDALVLEEVPQVEYEDIGGLRDQIDSIKDAIELPFLHAGLFAEHALAAPKGILL